VLNTGGAAGTYVNPSHLAGLLEMVLPIVLALLASSIGVGDGSKKSRRHGSRVRQQFQFLSSVKGHQAVIYSFIAILFITCLIFTKSRAAVAILMIGLFLSLFAFGRRLGQKNAYSALSLVVAIVLVLIIQIGLFLG